MQWKWRDGLSSAVYEIKHVVAVCWVCNGNNCSRCLRLLRAADVCVNQRSLSIRRPPSVSHIHTLEETTIATLMFPGVGWQGQTSGKSFVCLFLTPCHSEVIFIVRNIYVKAVSDRLQGNKMEWFPCSHHTQTRACVIHLLCNIYLQRYFAYSLLRYGYI